MDDILKKAIEIATEAHKGQKDKAGNDYIAHPLRVMNSVNTTPEKIVAVLHDVVEDTHITFENLAEQGIPENLIEVIRLLTHEPDVPYFDYIENLSKNDMAVTIKLADLKDNSNLTCLNMVTPKDEKRLEKYMKATDMLMKKKS